MPFDDDLIPRGDYCYHVWAVSDLATRGVYLDMHPNEICPYWLKTGHGTIRCERMGVEAVIEWGDYDENLRMAEAALGVAGLARVCISATYLTDQIKVCDIHPEVPGFDAPQGEDVLNWRA